MPDAYLPRFFSREGRHLPGEKRVVTVANPAAGAGWSVVVPGGRQWRIQAGVATLTTDAAVANRQALLTLGDGTAVWWAVAPSIAIPASTVQRIAFGAGIAAVSTEVAGQALTLPLPDVFCPPGTVLSVSATAEDVGDQFSAVAMLVEELWMDDQELTKLAEEKLASLGLEQLPWGHLPNIGG